MNTRIIEILKERGWSIHRLAKEIGGHRMTVYDVARVYSRGSKPYQKKIAAVLEVETTEIFSEIGMALISEEK